MRKMRKWKKEKKEKEIKLTNSKYHKKIRRRTLFGRSTFGFPFSNKSWTIFSYPSRAAI